MGFLKNIFKKKPGGTLFGNALRGVTKLASGLNFPGANIVSSLLPEAPPRVQQVAEDAISAAVAAPALPALDLKALATQIQQNMLVVGATKPEAASVGAAVYTAASLPPTEAAQALNVAAFEIAQAPVNSFGAGDVKKILNGAAAGARDGATSAYLNETELGKEQKKGAINAEGAKIMPWVIGGSFAFIAVLLSRSRN
jgi:hypothetical protein